ncbi:MAG: DUF423 domain-containing protein [Saprospiraceae bacterium]|nr:DUF423 domain-containing protein [Saprospiraceae bacterium]MBK8079689.1 DUF423 domain-containing protein [Saprospiraceae bacterium]MBK8818804.1 DUF423 domain-containing protein [Saprospiraceae bacterium]MBK9041705.1 DUF423 domain-containing protein [Saprospiraceae bacterium]
MSLIFLRLTAFLGFIAVSLGAFGAHGLKFLLDETQMETFRTGVLYHFIHVVALLAIGLSNKMSRRVLNISSLFFITGIILFSGSLYLLSCRQILGIEHWTFLGPLTPVGGLFFILGWLSLMFVSRESSV